MNANPMHWEPVTLADESGRIDCVLARPENGRPARSLCIFPGKSAQFIQDPEMAETLVRGAWAGGAAILCFNNYFTDLVSFSQMLRNSNEADPFDRADRRIGVVVRYCLDQTIAPAGRVAIIGVSRFGFAGLHAMAGNPEISAVAAISPVTWWPHLAEFAGLDEHPMILRHDLNRMVDRLPPRPVLVQMGTTDDRVGTDRCREFAKGTATAYRDAGALDRFCYQEFDEPGHVSNARFYNAVVDWLRKTQLIDADCR